MYTKVRSSFERMCDMEPIIRILEVELKNFKNVEKGQISFSTLKNDCVEGSDIVGLYGQNGSGKTAIVEAFGVLKTLLVGAKFPTEYNQLIYSGKQYSTLKFVFLVQEDEEKHLLEYIISFGNNNDRAKVRNETIRFKRMEKGYRMKELVSYNSDQETGFLTVRNMKKINNLNAIVDLKVNKSLSEKEKTSYLFRKETLTIFEQHELQEEYKYLHMLKYYFSVNLHILTNQNSGLIYAKIMLPIAFQMESSDFEGAGTFPLEFNEAKVIPKKAFTIANDIFQQINVVLTKIIPGLTVELNNLGNETDSRGNEGVRVELLSNRDGIKLPFWCESDGIKKLFSILSTLVTMFNKQTACIVIDELDAGIFEYLLGEIIETLHDYGKGQLLFTSHNLRLLEVLPKECLYFTTTNSENRYIRLTGIKPTNNIRDVYIRAVQLGGQSEEVYRETDAFYIRQAFRKAGEIR